ncbi:hypothetical protein EYF80_063402 [Liparis tanakae]|uniref:Uncharacterized protein n=1 Tax=Liparis tanakae TaxID=230148 RepID=A0A4Z2ED19_9TELE|nr:hypothetical protein EYF80_063402 [Liparis tanakae]
MSIICWRRRHASKKCWYRPSLISLGPISERWGSSVLYCFSKSLTKPIWKRKMSSMFPKMTFSWSSLNMSTRFLHWRR